jgi:hypothetical protein
VRERALGVRASRAWRRALGDTGDDRCGVEIVGELEDEAPGRSFVREHACGDLMWMS